MFDFMLSAVSVILVAIKIILYCFAIWGLVHYQWLDAIAFLLIGELLGWVGKVIAESSKADREEVAEPTDISK
jgi:hypothetical protein